MTTGTLRHRCAVLSLSACIGLLAARPAQAIGIDPRGDMKLGLRTYTAVRVGTERIGAPANPLNWPESGRGHVRQHRYFLQLDFDHDLTRLVKDSLGFAGLFRWLEPDTLKYTVQYRGEGEGIYDYGPSEYSDQGGVLRRFRKQAPVFEIGTLTSQDRLGPKYIAERIHRINSDARQRHRLFMAYGELEKGPFFVRVGRQVVAWGETDVFRLLDNINPVDDSFGGFFIALDERRIPIEMVKSSWQFGSIGPLNDTYLEGFAATGRRVSFDPGTPPGSPWSPGGLATPNVSVRQQLVQPDAEDIRGGARLVFNVKDATFSLAHYYTYLDVPGGQLVLPSNDPRQNPCTPIYHRGKEGNGLNLPVGANPICAFIRYPRVPVTGGSATFAIPSLYTIVRMEAAYFQDEPHNRQGVGDPRYSADSRRADDGKGTPGTRYLRRQNNTEGGLNPFAYPRFLDVSRTNQFWGRMLQRDSFNMAIGFDVNPWVRFLNPYQSFFVSTQLFYKHVFDSPGDLVLGTPHHNIRADRTLPIIGPDGALGFGCSGKKNVKGPPCKVVPRYYRLADDRLLHTLLITTAYWSGKLVPAFGMFYDWQGGLVFQPGVTYVRDPFRFVVDYTMVEANPTGQFGAVRDRDNLRLQVEFVF